MTDLKVIHDFIRDLANKEQGGWITPEQIDANLHRAQMWLFSTYVDQYAKTQVLHDALGTFAKRIQFVSDSLGLIQLPLTGETFPYEHLLSVFVQYWDNTYQTRRYKQIKILNDDEVGVRLDSQILKPTTEDPFGDQPSPGQIQLYPEREYVGNVRYLYTPPAPVFSYTASGRALVYNQAGSTQLLWNESSLNHIIVRAAQLSGVNLDDQLLIEITEQRLNSKM